ncbi:MAG: Ni/Fe hydrogenase subunit alpha [Gammaproteobacteria bacterium]|nr:Ni/Fe hydrogenase subunit alpha [Gammaproteobacteria bacterium]
MTNVTHTNNLETAKQSTATKRIIIEPVSRVEGHGKVSLLLDDNNVVQQARLHIVEFRGFEKFIQGRPYWELPVLVQRLCGICPVSHHLAAAKAIDQISGVDQLTPTAEKIRRLLHMGQVLQSHALHFFHLSSPDLLFGQDCSVAQRNVVGVLNAYPELAKQGILLRKYGQEVIRIITGKRVHGTCAIPGGVNKALSAEERKFLQKDINQIVEWSQSALQIAKELFMKDLDYSRQFARIDSHMMAMIGEQGELDLYHGNLRIKTTNNKILKDQLDYRQYQNYIKEQVKPWSYMKFPFLSDLGVENGVYRVGPLARLNVCDFINTEHAEAARVEFRAFDSGNMVQSTLAYHWARLIELLHCAEGIRNLLNDDDIVGSDLQLKGTMQQSGIGVLEAPRGTLIHDYQIDEDGLVSKANLIVSTTHNNRAMNESIRTVAADLLDGKEVTEPLLNQIEVAIRAYDPCLSCATHALGKMPLEVELLDANGEKLHALIKDSQGELTQR